MVDGCLTCGDVAVPVTVVETDGTDALCRDAQGSEGRVAVDLVGEVQPGERLLMHAGVAIERLDDERRTDLRAGHIRESLEERGDGAVR